MATQVIHTLKASGGDYSLISSWEAAQQRNLVTADEVAILECYDEWPSGLSDTFTIAGWTTDSTRNIIIRPATGNGHNGISVSSGFWLNGGNVEFVANIDQNYCEITGIGIASSGTYAGVRGGIRIFSNGPGRKATRCILDNISSFNTGSVNGLLHAEYPGSGSFVHSDILFASNVLFCRSAGCGIYANIQATAINNTVVGADIKGFAESNTGSRSLISINNVAYNCTTSYGISGYTGSTTNAASDAASVTPPGTSPLTTNVTSSDFVNTAGEDYHLPSASILKNAGTNETSIFTLDIDGDTLPTSGAWDIGADYYVAAGGTTLAIANTLGAVTNSIGFSISPKLAIIQSLANVTNILEFSVSPVLSIENALGDTLNSLSFSLYSDISLGNTLENCINALEFSVPVNIALSNTLEDIANALDFSVLGYTGLEILSTLADTTNAISFSVSPNLTIATTLTDVVNALDFTVGGANGISLTNILESILVDLNFEVNPRFTLGQNLDGVSSSLVFTNTLALSITNILEDTTNNINFLVSPKLTLSGTLADVQNSLAFTGYINPNVYFEVITIALKVNSSTNIPLNINLAATIPLEL